VDEFPKAHPLVKAHMEGMSAQMDDIQNAKARAEVVWQKLRGLQKQVDAGINRGMAIQRLMAGARSDSRAQDKVLERLNEEKTRVDLAHEKVSLRLEAIRKPRMSAVELKLTKRRELAAKTLSSLDRFAQQRAARKASALQTIGDKKRALQFVQDADEAIKVAERQEEEASIKYRKARMKLADEIEAYKAAQTRYDAAEARSSDESKEVVQAEVSVNKTRNIFVMERRRIDRSLTLSAAKLSKRVEAAHKKKEKAKQRFEAAEKRWYAWKDEQDALKKQVEALKEEKEKHREDETIKRVAIYNNASDKAGAHAVSHSDFDGSDWAWSGEGEFADLGEVL